ncbi:peroxidase family protein [Actinomycetospora flava]|uniref:Heme peroxidase family protein n=1 Tax=Actinomycetospora flava TaxID=3129232 RepID=A0ABU8M025_9PSEU
MSENGSTRRVVVGLRHGGHAIADEAPGVDDAVSKGSVRLSEVAQDPDLEKADPASALAMVGVTDFDYLFPSLVEEETNLLPAGSPQVAQNTVDALNDLGNAMVEQGPSTQNAPIPPIHTYWGQFVDHDLTAATDNNSVIGIDAVPLTPTAPADVKAKLKNGRNPALNLDSVYGDGPFAVSDPSKVVVPYQDGDRAKLKLGTLTALNGSGGVRIPPVDDVERDLPRVNRKAQIGDGRNDENLVVAQLHVAFLRFHNAAVDWVRDHEPQRTGVGEVFSRARELTRWTYQWLCVHDFLGAVLTPGTVDHVLASEDDLLGLAGRSKPYMPLEFSVAAFRFGHSMVRGAYDWNRNFGAPGDFVPNAGFNLLFLFTGDGKLGDNPTLPDNWPAEYDRLVRTDPAFVARAARPIDTRLALPLTEMENQLVGTSVTSSSDLGILLKHLARRNLLRGFALSLPTGQAVAGKLGITALTATELTDGLDQGVRDALDKGGFVDRTPLWFYVLRESEVKSNGHALGPVGSRIVAETIIGQIRNDPRSYLSQTAWTPADGVKLQDGSAVTSIAQFIRFAGFPV